MTDPAWTLYMHQNRRAREENEWSPLTNRQVTGPCIKCRARTTYTQRGVCRACTAKEGR